MMTYVLPIVIALAALVVIVFVFMKLPIIVRIFGYLLLLTGLAALGAEILKSLEAGAWTPVALGQRWIDLFGFQSMQSIQVGLQRYVHPDLWSYVVQPVFEAPAWIPLGVLGLILIVFARRRRQRRMFS